MRILILANYANGLYLFRKELVESFIADGHEVYVSVPFDDNCIKLERLGIKLIKTNLDRHGVNPLKDQALFRSYLKMMKELKPDVVLTYTIKPNVYGGYACGRLKIPYISTITGLGSAFEWNGLKKKLIVMMYKAGLKRCSCVFFQNKENMHIFEELGIKGKDTQLVNGSGVNLNKHVFEAYKDQEDNITKFLYIGRIMKEKGSDELLYAAKKLHDKYGDRVSVTALGYSEEDYEDKLKEAQNGGYLEVIPFQKDVHPYIKEADAILMPSYHEGMSNVILEASSTGRPVLASDISGCREGVDDGISGYLFKAQDGEALFAAMDKFMNLSVKDRADMGRAARVKMEKEFDREKVADAYLAKIKSILR
jgi:galacturonosyltransferase